MKFSNEAAAAAVDSAERVDSGVKGDLGLTINRTPEDPKAYPLVLVSYSIVCSTYEDQETVDLVKDFIGFQASAEGQAAASEAAGSAPISASMQGEIKSSLDMIQVAK